jgi:hypothetical protein
MGSARISILAAATAIAVSAFATAGPPVVSLDVSVDGNNTPFAPAGAATSSAGVYNYVGSGLGVGHITTWNFNATNSTETSPVFVSGNFTFTNTSNATQAYDVLVTLFTTPAGTSSLLGGSVAAGLTADFDGGTFTSMPNTPVWMASVDGNTVGSLLPAPISVTAGAFESKAVGSGAFGMPIPSQAGPALGNTMSIRLRFNLTAGDQASFTSVFVLEVVPAPAAGLAMFGLVGLTGRRRRA